MHDAQIALQHWKTIYDQLVQAESKFAALDRDDARERSVARRDIALLTAQSDAALAELNRCVALVNEARAVRPGGAAVAHAVGAPCDGVSSDMCGGAA